MKLHFVLTVVSLLFLTARVELRAAGGLAPNSVITLEFPELPQTFLAAKTGNKAPTVLTARLPSNYSPAGKFPIFVFLAGGDGGAADSGAAGGSRWMIGETDYISVALPLFKNQKYDPNSRAPNAISPELASQLPPNIQQILSKFATKGIVQPADYDVISTSYAAMLKKLNETVPNIDPSRSVLAGFSNGAHTIGVLLAGKDPVILKQFHSFAMAEGGLAFPMAMGPSANLDPVFKDHRYMFMFSDTTTPTDDQRSAPIRSYMYGMLKGFCESAKSKGFDFTFVTTHTGHHFGPAEQAVLIDWAKNVAGAAR